MSLRWLVLLFALAVVHPSFGAGTSTVLQPYQAHYELLRGGSVEGVVDVQLERIDATHWRMSTHSRGTHGLAALTGIQVRETSEFRSDASGITCTSYRYRQTGLRTRERSVDCGPGKAGVVSRDHKGEYRFAEQPNLADRQIVSLALTLKLASGKRGELSIPVVDRDRLEPQRYRTLGEETLALPMGSTRTLKLDRQHDSNERKTSTWFAIDQGWIPARIVHVGKSGGYELRLVSITR
jgi:hypothetical protein